MRSKEEILKMEVNFEPYANTYVLTTNKYFEADMLDLSSSEDPIFDHYQYVVCAGEGCKYEKGDKVLLDLEQFLIARKDPNDSTKILQSLDFKTVELNGDNYIVVDDSRRFIIGKELV